LDICNRQYGRQLEYTSRHSQNIQQQQYGHLTCSVWLSCHPPLGDLPGVLGEQHLGYNTVGNQQRENLFLMQATTNIRSFS
jgi:hypothetical protein